MGPAAIVEVDEHRERVGALPVRRVGASGRPFAEQILDDALRLAVGLGSPGPGALVPGTEVPEGIPIRVGPVPGAVVGQDPLDLDPEPGELGCGDLEGAYRARGRLVWDRDDDDIAARVVDHDLEVLVPDV